MKLIATLTLLLIWFTLGAGAGWLLHDKTTQLQTDITRSLMPWGK